MSSSNSQVNALLMITEHAPERLGAAKAERDELISKVLELNLEIARLETAIQVTRSPEPEKSNAPRPEPD